MSTDTDTTIKLTKEIIAENKYSIYTSSTQSLNEIKRIIEHFIILNEIDNVELVILHLKCDKIKNLFSDKYEILFCSTYYSLTTETTPSKVRIIITDFARYKHTYRFKPNYTFVFNVSSMNYMYNTLSITKLANDMYRWSGDILTNGKYVRVMYKSTYREKCENVYIDYLIQNDSVLTLTI
jgi:hypothetical protein